MNRFFIYDLETLPNCFLFSGKFVGDPTIYTFEISERKNQRVELMNFLAYLQNSHSIMTGFNVIGFDYPILHSLLTDQFTFTYQKAYALAQNIIQNQNSYGRSTIMMRDRIIPQVDLVKINHFDNPAKRTSLKSLQFAMRSESVEDLPFPFDQPLTFEQMDQLISYNIHDIAETEIFFNKNLHLIKMRQDLVANGVLSGDVLNYSDVKLGTEILIRRIGRNKCFHQGSTPRQTIRQSVPFISVILPKIHYLTESFNEVLEWFKQQTLWINGDERPSLERNLAGLDFHFGVGGLHASVVSRTFETSATHVIRDVDVSGMYPAVAIANGFYPEHLGQDFVHAYKQLGIDRKQYPKGSSMNFVLKLANNGVFGNSNNTYSCFYDPKFTYSITINGQLQLLQLVEMLSLIPGVQIIQANTDGITAYVPREMNGLFDLWCKVWEQETLLKLEEMEFTRMWIRDVNSYIAIGKNGEIKRKGAYWYPIKDEDYWGSSGSNWNKDFSNLSAQKGAEAVMIHGYRPEEVVRCFVDPFDFMLRYKTTGASKVYVGKELMPKTLRYYVSKSGQKATKVSPPTGELGTYKKKPGVSDSQFKKILDSIPKGSWDERIHTKNKSKYETRVENIESGWLIKECNNKNKFDWSDVDFDYYTEQIKKLVIGANHV